MKWHPDKHPNDKLATAKFQEIAEAYEEVSIGALIDEPQRSVIPDCVPLNSVCLTGSHLF